MNVLEQRYGEPAEGMQWARAGCNQLCFQAPIGWVLSIIPDEKKNTATFMPLAGEPILRVAVGFRQSRMPGVPVSKGEGVKPYQVSHEFQVECDHDPNFSLHKWTLTLASGDSEMLAVLCLSLPPGRVEEYSGVIELFEKTVELARYDRHCSEE